MSQDEGWASDSSVVEIPDENRVGKQEDGSNAVQGRRTCRLYIKSLDDKLKTPALPYSP